MTDSECTRPSEAKGLETAELDDLDCEAQSSNDPLGRFSRVQVLMGAEKVF